MRTSMLEIDWHATSRTKSSSSTTRAVNSDTTAGSAAPGEAGSEKEVQVHPPASPAISSAPPRCVHARRAPTRPRPELRGAMEKSCWPLKTASYSASGVKTASPHTHARESGLTSSGVTGVVPCRLRLRIYHRGEEGPS